jgi:hypothetical protein
MYRYPLFRSGLRGWSRVATLATICLTVPLSLLLVARAEEQTPQAAAAAGQEPRQAAEVMQVLSKQWLSDASCVSCHFQVPKQPMRRSLEAALVEKGYLTKSHLVDLAKAKTGQNCADCHTAVAPEGHCSRGEGCRRDAGRLSKVTYLGVSVGVVPQAVRQHVKLPTGVGLMIEGVEPGSPAAKAELHTYDILERLEQQILVNQEQFSALIKTYRPGDEVSLQRIRANEAKTLRVKLGDRVVDDSEVAELERQEVALLCAQYSQLVDAKLRDVHDLKEAVEAQGDAPKRLTYLGVGTSSPPDALTEQLKLTKGLGLLVDSVEPDSPAAAAGLRPFDVLQKLDDQLLVNSEQLTVLIRNHRPGDQVELILLREAQPLRIRATLGERQPGGGRMGEGATYFDFDNDGDLDVRVSNGLSQAIDLSTRGDVKDEEFVRRVYLNLVGTAPGPQELSHFASDDQPNKRQRLIDTLLSRPDVIDKVSASDVLHWSDNEHSLVLTTTEGDHKRLLAKDKQGNVVFDGSVDSDDERRRLGPPLAAKLDLMLGGLAGAPAAGSPADAEAVLEKVLSRFEGHEQTLDQLLGLLRRETGLNVVVDRKGLAAAGVKLDEPLSLDLHDVRARTVLKTLLVLAASPNARLKYEIEDGVVIILADR